MSPLTAPRMSSSLKHLVISSMCLVLSLHQTTSLHLVHINDRDEIVLPPTQPPQRVDLDAAANRQIHVVVQVDGHAGYVVGVLYRVLELGFAVDDTGV